MSKYGVVQGVSVTFCGVCMSDPCKCEEIAQDLRAVAESCEDADLAEYAVRAACAAYLGEKDTQN